jgi:hypothetical protein
MPSFRNILTEEQMWQLAAYVRAMGAQLPKDVPPSRGDRSGGTAADHAREEARSTTAMTRRGRGERIQSAAHPAGAHAAITGDLFGCSSASPAFFFLLVLVFLGWAIWRRDRGTQGERALRVTRRRLGGADHARSVRPDPRQLFRRSQPRLRRRRPAAAPIQVTAQQWWWEVEYQRPIQSNNIATANEIHLAGRPPAHLELGCRRRDPQPVDSQPCGQAGSDPRPHRRSRLLPRRTAISARNAPNSAGCSTRTWRST